MENDTTRRQGDEAVPGGDADDIAMGAAGMAAGSASSTGVGATGMAGALGGTIIGSQAANDVVGTDDTEDADLQPINFDALNPFSGEQTRTGDTGVSAQQKEVEASEEG